MQILFRKITSG